jgi:hypothetical protein
LHKRRKEFKLAIEEFVFGIGKMKEMQINDEILALNFNRQMLLTYNDLAIVCVERGFLDDAIKLMNKVIKVEKNEKGFYINRGGK